MRFITLLVFFFTPMLLLSKDNGRFRHFTTEDGLPQNSVYCMVQDQLGFMWIGTSDGLCRYDGYKFTIFRPDANDSSTISNNVIRCLLVDREGKIWAGTRDGLNCYDPNSRKFIRFYCKKSDPTTLSDNIVIALAEDSKGNILAASLSDGISVYDKRTGKFRRLRNNPNDANSIAGDDVRGMCLDKNGHVWMASWKSGVWEYDLDNNKRISQLKPDQLGYPNTRGAILCDKQGRIWIGTWMRGLDVYDPLTKKIIHEADNTPGLPNMLCGMIWSISSDKQGRILVATAEQGLIVFDPATTHFRKYVYDPDDVLALNDKSVWCVREDRSGQIWAGTWKGGINLLDERLDRFELLRFDPKDTTGLPSATVWSMHSDGGKGLWLGTSAGPVHYDPLKKKYFHPVLFPLDSQAPPKNGDIQSLCRDRKGNIWMGSAGNGAYFYDTTLHRFHHYFPNPGDPYAVGGEIVNALFTDEMGVIWLGAGHAPLQSYDPENDHFISYPFSKEDSLIQAVYVIASGGRGQLIVGTITGDVLSFDKTTHVFTHLWKNKTAIGIMSLYMDKFGGIWIGTNGSGLVYYKSGSAVFFTEKEGLPNNVINGIVAGARDELWLSTNHGLCRFDPISHDIRSYTPEDGLQGNEFSQNSNARTPDGKIWFGGIKGVNGFYPKDILPNLTPAVPVITSFTVLNKAYPLEKDILFTNEISLTYRDYFFSFDFAGLEFTNPERNRYKYMMEGFDPEWIDAGERRFVTYTNLDPGEYTFRVIASNNDGFWGGKQAVIHITITPPFWRTNWFYTLCGLMLILSIWLFIRRRERILRKEKEILETKVQERTFELNEEKEKVTAAHKDIRDSINYAKRIQYALLAHEELLKKNLSEFSILFRPKDVVSGDFYWATNPNPVSLPQGGGDRGWVGSKFYLAVCDSTGHGVPGAFMSLLNISFLNEAIIEKKMEKPGEVFDHVRKRLVENISQEGGQDGMDAILVCFDKSNNKVTYSAAHNAPLIVRNSAIIQLPADKMPVGKGEKNDPFTTCTMELQKGDMLYLYTDGFADQFGGPLGKKFKETNLRKLLAELSTLPVEEQGQRLEAAFDSWKMELEQVDDTLVIAIRIM